MSSLFVCLAPLFRPSVAPLPTSAVGVFAPAANGGVELAPAGAAVLPSNNLRTGVTPPAPGLPGTRVGALEHTAHLAGTTVAAGGVTVTSLLTAGVLGGIGAAGAILAPIGIGISAVVLGAVSGHWLIRACSQGTTDRLTEWSAAYLMHLNQNVASFDMRMVEAGDKLLASARNRLDSTGQSCVALLNLESAKELLQNRRQDLIALSAKKGAEERVAVSLRTICGEDRQQLRSELARFRQMKRQLGSGAGEIANVYQSHIAGLDARLSALGASVSPDAAQVNSQRVQAIVDWVGQNWPALHGARASRDAVMAHLQASNVLRVSSAALENICMEMSLASATQKSVQAKVALYAESEGW